MVGEAGSGRSIFRVVASSSLDACAPLILVVIPAGQQMVCEAGSVLRMVGEARSVNLYSHLAVIMQTPLHHCIRFRLSPLPSLSLRHRLFWLIRIFRTRKEVVRHGEEIILFLVQYTTSISLLLLPPPRPRRKWEVSRMFVSSVPI